MIFTNPDGSACQQPCLFGIRPGTTTYDQAVVLLKTHPLTRGYPQYLQAQFNPDGSVFRQIELVGSGTRIFMSYNKDQAIYSVQWRFVPARLAVATSPMPIPKYSDVVSSLGK